MGTSFKICCKNCDYSEDFWMGIGMMYDPITIADFDCEDPFLSALIKSKKVINQIQELLENKNARIAEGYGHEIFNCPVCGKFYNHFFIHLDYDGGSYEAEYECPKCRVRLKPIEYSVSADNDRKEINLKKYACPKCGNYKLYKGVSPLLWD